MAALPFTPEQRERQSHSPAESGLQRLPRQSQTGAPLGPMELGGTPHRQKWQWQLKQGRLKLALRSVRLGRATPGVACGRQDGAGATQGRTRYKWGQPQSHHDASHMHEQFALGCVHEAEFINSYAPAPQRVSPAWLDWHARLGVRLRQPRMSLTPVSGSTRGNVLATSTVSVATSPTARRMAPERQGLAKEEEEVGNGS